jgi:hypothetical protein
MVQTPPQGLGTHEASVRAASALQFVRGFAARMRPVACDASARRTPAQRAQPHVSTRCVDLLAILVGFEQLDGVSVLIVPRFFRDTIRSLGHFFPVVAPSAGRTNWNGCRTGENAIYDSFRICALAGRRLHSDAISLEAVQRS